MSDVSPQHEALYPFQLEAVKYLIEHGGGCVWSDPGLGKTRTAIVAAKHLGGPILVICPNSLKRWWSKEIRSIYPESSIAAAGTGGRFGPKSALRLPPNPIPFWTIVHYTGVRINGELARVPWKTVILDEAHYIKNRKAQRTRAVFDVATQMAYRIELTATPFGNNPADLWSQLRWIAPWVKGLRSYWKFYETFVDYEYEHRGKQRYRKIKGGRNLSLLAQVMSGYGIRHSKAVVAPQLPPIIDTYIPLAISPKQMHVYNSLRKKANVEIVIPADADGPATRLVVVNALSRLLRMEQYLSHPWKFQSGVNGAKLEWLLEWIEGYNKPAVIATRFKESAYHIANILKDREWESSGSSAVDASLASHGRGNAQGVPGNLVSGSGENRVGVRSGSSSGVGSLGNQRSTSLQGSSNGCATPLIARKKRTLCRHPITGDLPVSAREVIIEDWKRGRQQFLVGTIDTIGIGLSFERAHALVCYDQMYSSIKMDQVRQRVHRITTDHPVEVLYPYIERTTNEIVLESFTHRWKQMQLVRGFIEHIQEGE